MTTTRMRALALLFAAVVAAAAGCSSATTAETPVLSPEPAVTAAPSTVELPDPTDPVPTTCPEFLVTAAHLGTYWQYLNMNLGTTNDEGPTLADLRSGSVGMQELAPTCAPQAVEEIDAFAATVDPVIAVYTTQPEGEAVQQVDEALADMRDAGAAMFTALDMATYTWD